MFCLVNIRVVQAGNGNLEQGLNTPEMIFLTEKVQFSRILASFWILFLASTTLFIINGVYLIDIIIDSLLLISGEIKYHVLAEIAAW